MLKSNNCCICSLEIRMETGGERQKRERLYRTNLHNCGLAEGKAQVLNVLKFVTVTLFYQVNGRLFVNRQKLYL